MPGGPPLPLPPDPGEVAAAAAILSAARSVLFVTGAGISADSGLPTYRGVGGLYEAEDPDEGLPIEVLLSGETFARRPERTWKYLGAIERSCRGARPNRAHEAIAALEATGRKVTVLTQNVDGLHRAAGSTDVIEIHGDLHDLRCTRCTFADRVDDYSALEFPPRCPRCGGLVRPEVVLFGEMLPAAAVERLERALRSCFDAVFSVGTSSLFPYVAAPVLLARSWGGRSVEVNPGDTAVSDVVDVRLRCGAAVALGALADSLERAGIR